MGAGVTPKMLRVRPRSLPAQPEVVLCLFDHRKNDNPAPQRAQRDLRTSGTNGPAPTPPSSS